MPPLSLFYDPTLTWDKADISVCGDNKDPDVCRIYIHRRLDEQADEKGVWSPHLNYACFTFRLSSYKLYTNVGFFAMVGTMVDGLHTSSRHKEYEMSMRLLPGGTCVRLEGVDTLDIANPFCAQIPIRQLIEMDTTMRIIQEVLVVLRHTVRPQDEDEHVHTRNEDQQSPSNSSIPVKRLRKPLPTREAPYPITHREVHFLSDALAGSHLG
jgi:hypothetical protein